MRKAPLRLACPACLGVAMEQASVTDGVNVDHCPRCGGSWIPRPQAERLRAVPAAALRATLTRRDEAGFLCHACHAPMERNAEKCAGCGWDNRLECPECGKAMRRETERGVTVDVCRGCKAVWLDHDELASLWAVAAAGAVAVAKPGVAGRIADAGADAGGFLLDVLWWAPDLAVGAVHAAGAGIHLAANAAGAGLEAVSHAPGLLAAAPEMVAGAAEVAGEAAGSVFSVIAEIIGGLFDAF